MIGIDDICTLENIKTLKKKIKEIINIINRLKVYVKPYINNFNDTKAVTQKINPAMRGLKDRHAKFIDYKNIL